MYIIISHPTVSILYTALWEGWVGKADIMLKPSFYALIVIRYAKYDVRTSWKAVGGGLTN